MRWHQNSSALNLEQLHKTAIFGHTEQRLNCLSTVYFFHNLKTNTTHVDLTTESLTGGE